MIHEQSKSVMKEIGLISNLPAPILLATERQLMRLLKSAAGSIPFQLRSFSLSSARSSAAAEYCADINDLYRENLDGLFVTGAEPRTTSLVEESYWKTLTEIVDWAQVNTRSTIWSCLAPHAAVLYLNGIERRRLTKKCSGVYTCSQLLENKLTENLPSPLKVSHSRLHGLSETDLTEEGYQVLTKSKVAGVDIFVKKQRSQFIFFQGHPEYDAWSLQREYLRDLDRYLAGKQESFPSTPEEYFEAKTVVALEAFRTRVLDERNPALIAHLPKLTLRKSVTIEPAIAAITIFRNWIECLAESKAR
jgi:homoserine O-succinyltransferase/O-acetyltransferase